MPKTQKFNRDGKDWLYTPGKNASLVSIPAAGDTLMGMALNSRKTAKTIKDPSLKNSPVVKKRQGIAKILMNSKSGY